MTIRPSLIGALVALSLIVPSISSAQVTSGPVYSDIHKIDVREFAASLRWEAPKASDAVSTRRSAADNGYRWIDRIHNLPDYMHKYFPDVQPQLFPDALFTWYDIVNDDHKVTNGRYYMSHSSECDEAYYEFDFTKPYALISGSSALIGVCHGDMEHPLGPVNIL